MIQNADAHTLSNCCAKLRLYAQVLVPREDLQGGEAQRESLLASLPERLSRIAGEIDRVLTQLSPADGTIVATERPTAPGPGAGPERSLSPRVLLVDDDEESRELTRMTLELEGWEVLEAGDGPPALELLAQVPVQLVLLDTRLATLDGPAVVARLRSSESLNRLTPVVGLSASTLSDDRRQGLAAGMNDWLVKPLLRHHVDALRQWVKGC